MPDEHVPHLPAHHHTAMRGHDPHEAHRAATPLAAAGVSVTICLVLLMFAPVVIVIGYKTVGHRHGNDALRQLLES